MDVPSQNPIEPEQFGPVTPLNPPKPERKLGWTQDDETVEDINADETTQRTIIDDGEMFFSYYSDQETMEVTVTIRRGAHSSSHTERAIGVSREKIAKARDRAIAVAELAFDVLDEA